jgi:glucosamine-6-phosphate deaminase
VIKCLAVVSFPGLTADPLFLRKAADRESPLSEGSVETKHLRAGLLKVEVHPSRAAAGLAAARAAATALAGLAASRDSIGVIFATGASQFETLAAFTSMTNVPWSQVRGFHMDEYVGIAADHPASFRHYMRERLVSKVPMHEFFEMDGDAPDPENTAHEYGERLRAADPQLCLLGIGENGHLAFNDPDVADFTDPADAKIVHLDDVCRQQQVAEGWFPNIDEVADSAITLTIPTLMRVPRLIASVPGIRKAVIVKRTLHEPISTACPATILRTHPDATLYLDPESASALNELSDLG